MADEYLMDNPRSDRVKKVAALSSRAGRRKQGLFVAEGPQPVREALRLWLARHDAGPDPAGPDPAAPAGEAEPAPGAGHIPSGDPHLLPQLDALYFTSEALEQHPDLAALVDQARGVLFDPQAQLPRGARFFLREATSATLQAMSDAETPQGVLTVCRIPRNPGPEAQALLADRMRLGAALLGVQDPGNAGTIIRVADAAGADAVVLSPGTTDPWAPKVVRAAAGSHFHLPVLTGVDPAAAADDFRARGLQILAAHGYANLSLAQLQAGAGAPSLQRRTVWLFGNEAHGLSPAERDLADAAVSIPLYGQAESLNVAAAAGICLYASAMAQRAEGTP
ncbi:RNA methyltransferase [Nesterenkonia sp.]|uniref:TrmH family RNA methyltransferase n=1 Tax=Nesterenkonia sp. TaxID=704201 RepID=UPI0026333544|nr:RNA methyltransferase [Nesterenkonia sp.]